MGVVETVENGVTEIDELGDSDILGVAEGERQGATPLLADDVPEERHSTELSQKSNELLQSSFSCLYLMH